MALDKIQRDLLAEIADLHGVPEGAYNIRSDGKLEGRNTTANIDIVTKGDKPGIDIYVKPGTRTESVHIHVIIEQSGLKDLVYNDFHIGEGADVTIIAGCGINNCGNQDSQHDGIHSFYLDRNARLKYVEKHYADGDGKGGKIMNPTTHIELGEGAYMEMDTTQIKGIDSTERVTTAKLGERATLIVREKLMTHGEQTSDSEFTIDLDGDDSSANVISRGVARDKSRQVLVLRINGNARCYGHSECDNIVMDESFVQAVPEITANSVEASLVHEAAIGKIAGEQITKLMTLGLTEAEAEEQIVAGFLK